MSFPPSRLEFHLRARERGSRVRVRTCTRRTFPLQGEFNGGVSTTNTMDVSRVHHTTDTPLLTRQFTRGASQLPECAFPSIYSRKVLHPHRGRNAGHYLPPIFETLLDGPRGVWPHHSRILLKILLSHLCQRCLMWVVRMGRTSQVSHFQAHGPVSSRPRISFRGTSAPDRAFFEGETRLRFSSVGRGDLKCGVYRDGG